MIKMMILAVFRSRSQSIDYSIRLKKFGVPSETVAAPKEVKIGCGLCVRFEDRQFQRAKAVMRTGNYTTFKGFYKTEFKNGRMIILPYSG